MKEIKKDRILEKLLEVPGWQPIAEEIMDIAKAHDVPLRTIVYSDRKGLRPIYPRRPGLVSEEAIALLEEAITKSQCTCKQCGCETENLCLCEDCSEEAQSENPETN